MLKKYFHKGTLHYDGTQLRSHFAYDQFNICGDSIVAFIGPCDVSIDHMVDLEDVHQNLNIYSENMVHFIIEHFGIGLHHMVALQRLMVSTIIEELHDSIPELKLIRKGDDIYQDHYKINVSIATASPVSSLIHVGVNISSQNTPVPTKGLDDYNLSPNAFITGVMNRYHQEWESMIKARAKVRGVS